MDSMGPAPASRLEPTRLEDRQSRDRDPQNQKGNAAPSSPRTAGRLEQDGAEVAATEPEIHELDERA